MDGDSSASLSSPRTHFLHTQWILWREGGDEQLSVETTADQWCSRLKTVTKFSTVEDFWRFYNNCEPVSDLPIGMSLNLFKTGIKPLWEDPANTDGGRWYFRLAKPRHSGDFPEYKARIKETWLYIILSLLGNTIPYEALICGAVLSIRARESRFVIWTRKGEEPQIMNIGREVKKHLKYCSQLTYRKHSDRRRTSRAFYC